MRVRKVVHSNRYSIMKLFNRLLVVAIIVAYSAVSQTAHAQGVMLRSVGPVNAAVGGTAVAMPLDASGALYWNPATISALPKNEMTFGLELIQAHSRVESSLPTSPNLGPFSGLSGSTKGESGVIPAPSMAFVWSTSRQSPFTFGFGMAAVGGAASLYPHEPMLTGNPVLGGFPPLGNSGKSASVVILQVTPTVSAQLTERWSVGVAPLVDLASLNINPMSLGRAPAPGDALTTYGTNYVWGGGFQIGTLYDFQNHFKAGFTFKSPIWAEKLYYTGTNVAGDPATAHYELNLPMTLSWGVSYDGFRDTVIGMDIRYMDYANTTGFKKSSHTVVSGLDWESVYSVSVGAERKINDRLKARAGYCWNENPIPSRSTFSSISAPMIGQHVMSLGFGFTFAKDLELSAAYCHVFEAKSTGEIPGLPGSSVTNTLSADSFFTGITKKW